ncbi:MAG: FAD-binding protein [Nitrospirae bacterium]|nr:FAD-binding protein [Nitrospirota bacterium]
MRIVVDTDRCTACGQCVDSCPFTAIEMKNDKAFINEYCQFCRACLSACPEGAIIEIAEEGDIQGAADISGYKGVWVFAEQREGRIAPVAFELLGAGRRLATELKTDLSAILFGGTKEAADELIKWGADKVYHCSDKIFASFNDEPYSRLLADLINKHKPEIVLAGATPIGRSFIPRVAARLKTGLTADCTSLQIDEGTRALLQVRPAFGGNIMATIICPNHRPQMATVRPRVMKRGDFNEHRKGEIISVSADNLSCRTKVLDTVKEAAEHLVNLQDAEVIVAGGRGMGGTKGFELLQELAGLLNAAVAASRAAVDEGWIPYSHQVGQTGKTVCPKVYIACGISGAVQHLVGMQSSDVIIAINKNPDAPIFNAATCGIVGDANEVVPMLIKKLKELGK